MSIAARPVADLKDAIRPIWFEWGDGCEFKISSLDDELRTKFRTRCETTVWKKHQKETETDWVKFARLVMEQVIVEWIGMTYATLIELCKPLEFEKACSPKLTDQIEFSVENRDFIIQNCKEKFQLFVIQAIDFLQEQNDKDKKKELENLSRTSGGSEAPQG